MSVTPSVASETATTVIWSRSRRGAPGRSGPAPLRAGTPGSRALRSWRDRHQVGEPGRRVRTDARMLEQAEPLGAVARRARHVVDVAERDAGRDGGIREIDDHRLCPPR